MSVFIYYEALLVRYKNAVRLKKKLYAKFISKMLLMVALDLAALEPR